MTLASSPVSAAPLSGEPLALTALEGAGLLALARSFTRSWRRRWKTPGGYAGTQPTVSGTVGAGNTLTADPGTWAPAGSSYLYQWRVGSDYVAGATSSTYVVQAGDVSQSIECCVVALVPSGAPVPYVVRVQ